MSAKDARAKDLAGGEGHGQLGGHSVPRIQPSHRRGGEWRCLGGIEEAWVLLQLEEPCFITNLEFLVVNEQMVAAIEVKV